MKIQIFNSQIPFGTVDLGPEIINLSNARTSFFVGRSEDCQIVLNDMKVSREHLELIFDTGIWKVKNISSIGGFQLNGILISGQEEILLNLGDILSIGPFNLNIIDLPTVKGKASINIVPQKTITDLENKDENADNTQDKIQEDNIHATASIAEEKKSDQELKESLDEQVETPIDPPKEEKAGEQINDHLEEQASSESSPEQQEGANPSEFQLDANQQDVNSSENLPAEISESEGGTKVFKSFAKFDLEIFGEYAPYDKYSLEASETYIGRDPKKCQIVLNDPESSSVHAVIRKNNITCTLEDLKSSNGTILNGERINRSDLTNNDEFVIGSTTFTVKVRSELIKSEDERLMPVETNQVVEVEEVVEVAVDEEEAAEQGLAMDGSPQEGGAAQEKSFLKRMWKDPAQRKKLLYGAVVLVMALMFLPEEEVKKEDKKKPADDKSASKDKEGEKKDGDKKDNKSQIAGEQKKEEKPLSPEQKQYVESAYQLAKELHDVGKYGEAISELDKIFALTSNYKEARSLKESAKEGLAKLEELERKRREEEERKILQQKVKDLVEKAKVATKERQVEVAEAIFGQVLQMDPENFDVPQLKIELDAWKKEQERIEMEKAQKEADRKRKVGQLQPGKNLYLQKDWFKSIIKLEEFLKITDMDEDLTKEATTMLEESRKNLSEITSPLLGKARSLKEGQDLKGAYENFMQVLIYDPINTEAQDETNAIRDLLNNRAKKIYREAIISESLSLFSDAKEKFQEVQQMSPSDSDYYKKASEKLKDYLD